MIPILIPWLTASLGFFAGYLLGCEKVHRLRQERDRLRADVDVLRWQAASNVRLLRRSR